MFRNIFVGKEGLVTLTFRGICHTESSERLRAGREFNYWAFRGFVVAWKLRHWCRLFGKSSKVSDNQLFSFNKENQNALENY